MHDLIENRPDEWTFQDLQEIGFSDFTIDGVCAMTKPKGWNYFPYLTENFCRKPQYIPGKLSDFRHNTLPSRRDAKPDYDTRMAKYHIGKLYLSDLYCEWRLQAEAMVKIDVETWMVRTGRNSAADQTLLALYGRNIASRVQPPALQAAPLA